MKFELQAEFIINERNEKPEKSSFKIEYDIRLLKKDDSRATIYDESLGIHFENPMGMRYIYEVETTNVELILTKRLQKSQEIMRRLFYRYDWGQLYIDAKGLPLKVLNAEELKHTWTRLKKRILVDYKGEITKKYLERIDLDYQDGREPSRSVNHLLHFGLLLPRIPSKHSATWSNQRSFKCSEFDSQAFVEDTGYERTENGLRYYTLHANVHPDSQAKLIRYEGYTCVSEDDTFPTETNLLIEYLQGDQSIIWNFKLGRK